MSWFDDSDVPTNLKSDALALRRYFERRRSSVLSVRCFYNFRVERGVYSGICVQVKASYALTEEDACWVSPDHYRTTSVTRCNVTHGTYAAHKESLHANAVWAQTPAVGDHDAGLYVERVTSAYSTDDDLAYFMITTSSTERAALQGTVEKWVASARRASSTVDAAGDHLASAVETFPSAVREWSATTNHFVRDNSTWRYIGNVMNVQPGAERDEVFIRSHPSVGYERFSVEASDGATVVPMDMGYAASTTALENLDSARARHVASTHRWMGEQCVHSRVQRDASNWRESAPLRKMSIFAPRSMRVCAIKLALPRGELTLEEGWELTKRERVHYAFETVAPQLTPSCVPHLVKPAHCEGSRLSLSHEDCARMGIL